jgi:hypothetical protein
VLRRGDDKLISVVGTLHSVASSVASATVIA